jgi:uncharacterized protein
MIGGNPQYVPDFKVKIANVDIPWSLRASIMSARLTAGLEGSDQVQLSIFNEHLKWLDDPRFAIETPLRLSIGYQPKSIVLMFVGAIKAVQATFPSSGTPTLEVTAQDLVTDMQDAKNSRWFANEVPTKTNQPVPRDVMANQVASKYGLVAQFDPTGADLAKLVGSVTSVLTEALGPGDPGDPQRGVDRQVNSVDYDLLKRVARESGYDLMIDHTSQNAGKVLLFFAPWDHLTPDVALTYGETLMDFTPRLTQIGQIGSVIANVWQPGTKKTVAVTLGWDWKRMGLALSVQQGQAKAAPGSSDLVIDEPLTVGTAPRRLISELIPKLNNRITGSGSAVGDPALRPGAVVKIDGVGVQFGGYYRITKCTHTIDSGGYRTEFDVRKEIWFTLSPTAQGAVQVFLPSPQGAAGGNATG